VTFVMPPSLRPTRRLGSVAALVVALAAAPPPAVGHGGVPTSVGAARVGGAPDGTLVVLTNYGFQYALPDGSGWEMVCDEMFGENLEPSAAFPTAAAFVVNSPTGIYRSDDGGCTTHHVDASGVSAPIAAVVLGDAGRVFAATAAAEGANDVLRSDDHGRTWEPLGAPAAELVLTGLRVLPGEVLVALGHEVGGGELALLVREPGEGWRALALDPALEGSFQRLPRLHACDPGEARCLLDAPVGATREVVLVHLEGDTHATVYPVMGGSLYGATFTPEGAILLALGAQLARSEDGGATWREAPARPRLHCLREIAGELFGCSEPWWPGGFTLGRSPDDGRTWEPVMGGFRDVEGVRACPPGSPIEAACDLAWTDLRAILEVTEPGTPPDDPGPEPEPSGPGDEPASPAAGAGGCALGLPGAAGGAPALLLIGVALVLYRRARGAVRGAPEG